MSLTADEVAALAAEAAPILEGAAVENAHQPDEHTLVLTVHLPASPKRFLLFSTRPRLYRFHLTPNRPAALPEPPAFCAAARKLLKGSRLNGLRQVSGDRIVEASFTRRAGEAGGEQVFLILEMMGGRGQLVLVREDRTLLATLHPFRRGSREVRPGEPYRFPEARAQPPQLKALGRPWRYLEEGASAAGPEAAADSPAPLHLAIARHYARLEDSEILLEKKRALGALLGREAARRADLARKVREDLARAEAGEEHRVKGELLKGAFARLHRGLALIELENYFEPGFPKLEVNLDPALGPRENVERYFKRWQKCRRAVPFLRERLARIEAERDLALDLTGRLEPAADVTAVRAIEEEAGRALLRRQIRKAKGPQAASPLGPRRFASRDGFDILVGRNAKQNDELTLRVARGNDIFLHVAGRAGSHVIVRSVPGKQPPLETLLDAAQLALYYSLPERQRAAAATAGSGHSPSADVDYTPVKHVRKPGRSKPGLVLLATHKTLRVRLEPERLQRLRQGEGRDLRQGQGEGQGPAKGQDPEGAERGAERAGDAGQAGDSEAGN